MNAPNIKEPYYSYQQLPLPVCGISQCLLGDNVRYDGTNKKHSPITKYLKHFLHFITLCPEVAAGFGVPRPAIQLTQKETIQVLQVKDASVNLTTPLKNTCNTLVKENDSILGFIVKARSPSCGNGSTPLFINNKTQQTTDGLLVRAIKKHLPWALIIEEEQLLTEEQCQRFATKLRFSQELFYAEQHNNLAEVSKYYGINVESSVKEWLIARQKTVQAH